MGSGGGFLRAKVVREEDKLTPPLQGWQYRAKWEGTHQWESDPTLECHREVLSACSEVIVDVDGATREKRGSFAGSYKPVEGKLNRGRWVGSYRQILTLLMTLTVCRCCSIPQARTST